MITVEQIAQEIIADMEITDKTESQISAWIRANVGRFNNLTGLSLAISTDTNEFTPDIDDDIKDIIKCAYAVSYLKNLAKSSLTGAASQVLSMSDDVSSVRFVNINEVAKVWQSMAKEEQEKLDMLAKHYRYNEATPLTYVAPSLCSTIAPQHYNEGDNTLQQ